MEPTSLQEAIMYFADPNNCLNYLVLLCYKRSRFSGIATGLIQRLGKSDILKEEHGSKSVARRD